MLEITRSLISSSLISPGSFACSSAPMPSRKPLKKSFVDAYIIFGRMPQLSGALLRYQVAHSAAASQYMVGEEGTTGGCEGGKRGQDLAAW